ncbi:PilZ domain-containing protein [Spirochaeta thermophila]|uniref:PilZ domain-containing protein n=1 Tax=Winmispira thermophila (strain ATCC 49972 / DSM 6192 / RI 19.B1) TaxID=665571 RepID=E0RR57_WINT6|nr:PilZ domain-containing protein [Spirochaeta thermophila]ADN01635.1 hypothetical protein STHERM_c06760 [Spirochaeta thermophila DSM 6192]
MEQREEKRKVPRDNLYAKALIEDEETPAYVRDISVLGCKLEFLKPLPLEEGAHHVLQVIPLEETGIPPFEVTAEVRWTAHEDFFYTAGFRFVEVPIESSLKLKKLVEFIRDHVRTI